MADNLLLEQQRLLYELHDTVKQNVHGVSLTLRAALDAECRGDHEVAVEMFGRALRASREAEFRISRPYDELAALRGESPSGAGDFLRQRPGTRDDGAGEVPQAPERPRPAAR